jgi:hypothetical protein
MAFSQRLARSQQPLRREPPAGSLLLQLVEPATPVAAPR